MHYIKGDKFWKCINLLVRAVFPTLRLLCYCDKSKPAMEKIFFLSHRTTLALKKLEKFLNNRSLFGSLRSDSNLTTEGNIVLGEGGDTSDEEDVVFENAPPNSEEESNNDEESIDEDAPTQLSQVMPYNLIMSFGCQVILALEQAQTAH